MAQVVKCALRICIFTWHKVTFSVTKFQVLSCIIGAKKIIIRVLIIIWIVVPLVECTIVSTTSRHACITFSGVMFSIICVYRVPKTTKKIVFISDDSHYRRGPIPYVYTSRTTRWSIQLTSIEATDDHCGCLCSCTVKSANTSLSRISEDGQGRGDDCCCCGELHDVLECWSGVIKQMGLCELVCKICLTWPSCLNYRKEKARRRLVCERECVCVCASQ